MAIGTSAITHITGFIEDLLDGLVQYNSLSPIMRYFNSQLFEKFNPDITGYTLTFFVPPPFSMLKDPEPGSILLEIRKLVTFAAIDFTPPTYQVQGANVNPHLGGIPFAVEIAPSQQCSVTYIDNSDLNIFTFHCGWVEYIKGLIEGIIESPDLEEGLDYAGTLYIVKYSPAMRVIKYVGKCTGVFPQNLPNKEVLGQRTQNDLATLPITYFCTFFEESLDSHHPIFQDLEKDLSHFEILPSSIPDYSPRAYEQPSSRGRDYSPRAYEVQEESQTDREFFGR